MSARRPVVGVLGSGSLPWRARAEPLGRALAERGVHLLTGGGGGVMAAVSAAFASVRPRAGLVLGVLPGDAAGRAPAGYPNPDVEVAIATHLPDSGVSGTLASSRNHVNVLSSDVLVVLPGAAGTASEVELCLRYDRPVVAWIEDPGELPGLSAAIRRAASLPEVLAFLDAELGPAG